MNNTSWTKKLSVPFELWIKAALLGRGLWTSRTTNPRLVGQFISSIRPKTTNIELVRFGGDHDGGYLIPDDLEGVAACFSAGVGNVADFECDMANRGIRCFLADYSVDAPPVKNNLFDFEKKYIGTQNDSMTMTLQEWVGTKAPQSGDLILQMDIEGAEYGVLMDSSTDILKRFRIMALEFHRLDAICARDGIEIIALTFQKLLKHFEVVHIHPNNLLKPVNYRGYEIPPCLEFTFLRRDRISNQRSTSAFPHPLDRANVPEIRDYALPRCWFE